MVITNPDWVPPIEMTFDVEKPIRSEQGLMLAGNTIAMGLGKPGAQRIEDAALSTTATSTGRDWVAARLVLSGSTSLGIPMFMSHQGLTAFTFNPNDSAAGSSLRFTSGGVVSATAASGTWLCLGYCITNNSATIPLESPDRKTTWMRIA